MNINRYKGVILIFITFIVIFIFTMLIVIDKEKIKVDEVEKYFSEEENFSYDKGLGEKLISILPKEERKKIEEYSGKVENVKIIKEKNLIDNKDCILLFLKKDKKSFIFLFQKKSSIYVSMGLVDIFSEIEDIQFINIKKENTNIIFVREIVDQLELNFEKGKFIKGYYYDNHNFSMVLSITEEYEIYSNNITDRWKKVYEKSDIKFTNEYYPMLEVLEHQIDFVSEVTSQKNIPKKDMFDVINTRSIFTKYIWSDKYKHFIIGEGVEKTTGERVAIVEDLHFESDFVMDEIENMKEKYIIKDSKGLLKVVEHSDISISKEIQPLKLIN